MRYQTIIIYHWLEPHFVYGGELPWIGFVAQYSLKLKYVSTECVSIFS